ALIYRRLIHRTEPNRPHISSDIKYFKQRWRQKQTSAPKSLLARRQVLLRIFPTSATPRLRFVPSAAPSERLCSSGKGGSRVSNIDPQPLFTQNMNLLVKDLGSPIK
ncbi:MAG: hypothetical protein ACI9HB_002013, partial [Gammaproteobacteria bacterium]